MYFRLRRNSLIALWLLPDCAIWIEGWRLGARDKFEPDGWMDEDYNFLSFFRRQKCLNQWLVLTSTGLKVTIPSLRLPDIVSSYLYGPSACCWTRTPGTPQGLGTGLNLTSPLFCFPLITDPPLVPSSTGCGAGRPRGPAGLGRRHWSRCLCLCPYLTLDPLQNLKIHLLKIFSTIQLFLRSRSRVLLESRMRKLWESRERAGRELRESRKRNLRESREKAKRELRERSKRGLERADRELRESRKRDLREA